MATLDVSSLLNSIITVAKGSIPNLKDVAVSSFKTLSQNLVDIEEMKLAGTITQDQAILLIDMQKNAVQNVLITEEGLGLLAAQNAMNAALDIVKGTVNSAIGWALL